MTINSTQFKFQPYINKTKAFSSVTPQGWMIVAPGIHIEKPNGTTIFQTAFSTSNISSLLSSLMSNTGIKEMPIAVDIREANGLLWKLYRATNSKHFVDVALSQSGGETYVVLLQSLLANDNLENANLFLTIIDNFTPQVVAV